MAWRLNYRGGVSGVPVELDGILPERLRGMTRSEIERLPIAVGNRQLALGELFAVKVVGDDAERMELDGDLSGVHWLGHTMSSGSIHVQGDIGRHLGSEMRGGRIEVAGSAGDWLGAELKGGQICVKGSAGHLVGSAYRGSRRGMTGGTILVHGDVGNELGHSMRRGLLGVGGAAGDLIGFNLLAGSIMVFGSVGIRHGAGMQRGTIGLFGAQRPELLPSFRFACRLRPLAVSLALRHLTQLGVTIAAAFVDQACDVFNGDLNCEGRGELLIGAT